MILACHGFGWAKIRIQLSRLKINQEYFRMQIRKENKMSREVKPLKKKQQKDLRALHTVHDRNDHLLSDFL